MLWQALQIAIMVIVVANLALGAGLALCFVASFINRIGNPYDKW